ncbi:hypothetical protein R6Q59_009229 [Mikania micrantha]
MALCQSFYADNHKLSFATLLFTLRFIDRESLQAKTPLNVHHQRDDFVPTLRSASMAWEVIPWVIFFIMNVALIASNMYRIVCLTDLETDYMNLYDLSARINAVVIPEMVVRGVWRCLFLLTWHWFMFMLALPIMIYNTMLYSKRRHLTDGGNLTLYSNTKTSTTKGELNIVNAQKSSIHVESKHNLVDVYDVDDSLGKLASKAHKEHVEDATQD